MVWITRYFIFNDDEVGICDPKNGHVVAIDKGHPIECKYNDNEESFVFKDMTILLNDCKLR